jgi:MFS family permease
VRTSLFIAVGFTVLQQVTGINTIIYYGPHIFALAGITSNKSAIFATLLVGVTNMLATIIALALVDRVGRKPLLYAGVSGMTACLILLAYSFHSPNALGAAPGVVATICLMVYITCFAFSMGPIAWILVSEVFPLRVRGRGVAAASLGSGASNFLVSMTFLSLINAAGNANTFLLYATFCILTLLFVYFVVPETRGLELEAISSEANGAATRLNEQVRHLTTPGP